MSLMVLVRYSTEAVELSGNKTGDRSVQQTFLLYIGKYIGDELHDRDNR